MAFQTISGTPETLQGTNSIDTLLYVNQATDLYISALGDNDTVQLLGTKPSSDVTIYGGDGDDSITSQNAFADGLIQGGAGTDSISLTQAVLSSVVRGGADNDSISAQQGGTLATINGNNGSDTITVSGTFGQSRVYGGKDNDTIALRAISFSRGSINANMGNDTLNDGGTALSLSESTIFGGTGSDSFNFTGNSTGLVLSGDNGDDVISATGAGDNTVYGGTGADLITTGAGDDSIIGGQGTDNISGASGADTIAGGSGNDTIDGGAGVDVLTAGSGDDLFRFDTGDVAVGETFDGGSGNNTLLVVTSTDFSNLGTATVLTNGNVQNIQITSATTGTFTGSQVSGQALTVNGAGAAGVSTLDVNVSGTTAVSLASMTFAATGSGTAFTDGTDIVNIDGDTAANTITATSIADIINGDSGADVISAGSGNDTITGGVGADQIDVGTGTDRVVATTFATTDTITNWTAGAGADVLAIDVADIQAELGGNPLQDADGNDVSAGAATLTNAITVGQELNLLNGNILRVNQATVAGVEGVLNNSFFTLLSTVGSGDGITVAFIDANNDLNIGIASFDITTNILVGEEISNADVQVTQVFQGTYTLAGLNNSNFLFI